MTKARLLAVLGWSHLLGGLVGLGGLAFLQLPGVVWPLYWYVTGALLSALSVASGVALLRRHPARRRLATLVEGLQLVAFHTGRFGFLFYSGLQALLVISPSHLNVSASVQSQFGIGPAMRVTEPFIAIDVLTLAAWWLLWRTKAPDAEPSAPPTRPAGARSAPAELYPPSV